MKSLTPIILTLVSIGVFFFFIDPQKKELDLILKEKKQNEIMLEKARNLRDSRGRLQEAYNKIGEEDRAKLLKILPDTVDNVRLILDIDNLASKKYGIALKGISVSGGPLEESKTVNNEISDGNDSSFGTIKISFSFSSSYDIFKIFMKDLQDSLRLIDITDFSISSSDDGLYDYSITLNTYWLR
jgi:Tfp pilus assembly protein PilO